jgi:hypothetical protein
MVGRAARECEVLMPARAWRACEVDIPDDDAEVDDDGADADEASAVLARVGSEAEEGRKTAGATSGSQRMSMAETSRMYCLVVRTCTGYIKWKTSSLEGLKLGHDDESGKKLC